MRENTSTEWVNKEVDSEGNFNRQKNQFETPFGEGEGKLPVEPGRYRLLWAPVCPWAHRSVIVRRLLGLEDVISLGTADPKRPDVPRSDWAFTLDEGDVDPVLGIHYISEAYLAANPDYTGRFTVPALGFYEKLGYTADFSQVSGSGEFECVMTEKELA